MGGAVDLRGTPAACANDVGRGLRQSPTRACAGRVRPGLQSRPIHDCTNRKSPTRAKIVPTSNQVRLAGFLPIRSWFETPAMRNPAASTTRMYLASTDSVHYAAGKIPPAVIE